MKKLILLAFIGWVVFHPVKASIAQAPERKLTDYSITEIVQFYAEQYSVSAVVLEKVMFCESSGRQEAVGDGGRAVGIFQFHAPTWDEFSRKLGEDLDRNSYMDQAKLAAFAFSKGLQSHWTCYNHLYGKKLATKTS